MCDKLLHDIVGRGWLGNHCQCKKKSVRNGGVSMKYEDRIQLKSMN